MVGKRFNAFAAEQWLTADGDGRDPAEARAFDAPCDRLGCVAALPRANRLDRARSPRVRRRLRARASRGQRAQRARGCKAKFLFDEQALARLGAIGLTWSDNGFTLASGRSPTENRPWSPAPAPARDDRIVRPGHGGSRGADPADAADQPEEGR